MSDQHHDAGALLSRLRILAEDDEETASDELRNEYERWRIRFELLAQSARGN